MRRIGGGGGVLGNKNSLLLYDHALYFCDPLWWGGKIVSEKCMLLASTLDFGDNLICCLPESSSC